MMNLFRTFGQCIAFIINSNDTVTENKISIAADNIFIHFMSILSHVFMLIIIIIFFKTMTNY